MIDQRNNILHKIESDENDINDILTLYLFALRSPVTKNKYTKRLENFFDFLSIEGHTIRKKSTNFTVYIILLVSVIYYFLYIKKGLTNWGLQNSFHN